MSPLFWLTCNVVIYFIPNFNSSKLVLIFLVLRSQHLFGITEIFHIPFAHEFFLISCIFLLWWFFFDLKYIFSDCLHSQLNFYLPENILVSLFFYGLYFLCVVKAALPRGYEAVTLLSSESFTVMPFPLSCQTTWSWLLCVAWGGGPP